jgi:uncharacterized protein
MKIWALDDGVPGHWSMTEGLTRLIGGMRQTEVTRVRVDWRWGPARQLFQRCERLGIRVPAWCVNAAVRLSPEQASLASPDLVVSRGGSTLFMNAWLARQAGCANVFIGKLRQMPTSSYSAVILRQDERIDPPYFPLPLFPTRIDQASLEQKAAEFPWSTGRPSGRVVSLLIGGDGSGHEYTKEDWAALAAGMGEWHRKHGVRWCVTTSRRTPAEVENLIIASVPAAAIHEACWWNRGDRRVCMVPFLAVAEQVFCTSDSMSMLEEVIASGRPLIGLHPVKTEPNVNFRGFLAMRVKAGRLVRMPLADFAKAASDYPVPNTWNLVVPGMMEAGTRGLLEFLKL